jgi:hypothetical protein
MRVKTQSSVSVPTAALDVVEAELPLTPIQEDLISKISSLKAPERISFDLPLPDHPSLSLDYIQHAWQAIASHNPVLRTRLDVNIDHSASVGGRQSVLKNILPIQFQAPPAITSPSNSAARLVISASNNGISASVFVHRALIDDSSVAFIRRDFEMFFKGVALNRHPSLERFIRRANSKDGNAAKLFWRARLAGVRSSPLHGFPSEPRELAHNVTATMDQERSDALQKFAESSDISVRSILYAAWAFTLAVHTEAGDNRVSFSVVGRNASHTGDLGVVSFSDLLYPMVVTLNPNQSVGDLALDIAKMDTEGPKYAFIGYKAILSQASKFLEQTLVHVRFDREGVDVEVSLRSNKLWFP